MKWMTRLFGIALVTGSLCSGVVLGDNISESSAKSRVAANKVFHLRANQKMGLLIPLYINPANIHTNSGFNRVMDLKRQYSEVPFWVVLNPASGPGNVVDGNYTKAVDRLIGAGCVVLGYVPTGYGKTSVEDVSMQMKSWKQMYPRVHGVFFDEMIYEDTEAGAAHQKRLSTVANENGFWPTVGNPGADTPGRYFAAKAADVIVVHESAKWPTETKLHGDYFGGYSDYPPSTRATLIHSQPKCDTAAMRMARKYTRFIYVTHDTFKPNDPAHPNPWDKLSVHLETMCKTLAQ